MTNSKITLSIDDVKKIGKLASIPISDKEAEKLSFELSETLGFIQKIKKIDTQGVKPTSHVTGLSNVYREDEIKPSLSQEQALSGAKSTYNGYFKVPAVLEE